MIVKKKDRKRHENSATSIAYEYTFKDKDINVAVVEIRGRYPEEGFVLNEEVKEMFFVNFGIGTIVVDQITYELEKGDMFLILPKQKYFLKGDMDLIVSCTPSWNPRQYKNIK